MNFKRKMIAILLLLSTMAFGFNLTGDGTKMGAGVSIPENGNNNTPTQDIGKGFGNDIGGGMGKIPMPNPHRGGGNLGGGVTPPIPNPNHGGGDYQHYKDDVNKMIDGFNHNAKAGLYVAPSSSMSVNNGQKNPKADDSGEWKKFVLSDGNAQANLEAGLKMMARDAGGKMIKWNNAGGKTYTLINLKKTIEWKIDDGRTAPTLTPSNSGYYVFDLWYKRKRGADEVGIAYGKTPKKAKWKSGYYCRENLTTNTFKVPNYRYFPADKNGNYIGVNYFTGKVDTKKNCKQGYYGNFFNGYLANREFNDVYTSGLYLKNRLDNRHNPRYFYYRIK